jgi:hypothetical protein
VHQIISIFQFVQLKYMQDKGNKIEFFYCLYRRGMNKQAKLHCNSELVPLGAGIDCLIK